MAFRQPPDNGPVAVPFKPTIENKYIVINDKVHEIKKVIVGESVTFPGGPEFMRDHGVEVTDLDLDECKKLMTDFIEANPKLWNEDIGEL